MSECNIDKLKRGWGIWLLHNKSDLYEFIVAVAKTIIVMTIIFEIVMAFKGSSLTIVLLGVEFIVAVAFLSYKFVKKLCLLGEINDW